MSEQVAVVIPASLEMAQAFQKIFPNAQIRKIKRKEEDQQPEPRQQAAPIKAETPQERERLLNDIMSFCRERKSSVEPVRFFNYYDGRGWLDASGNKISDWKQKVIEWENNGIANKPQKPSQITGSKVVNFSKEQMDKYMEGLEKI